MFSVEGLPYSIGCFPDPIPFDQFPCHRREHVVVLVDVLEPFAGKLALHGEGHEEFLSHEAQTCRLHRPFIAKKLHADRPSLSDSPRPAAGLPQRMQGISRLIEDDGWEIEQVETCFHQLGMRDDYLDAILDLSRVPGFPF